MIPNIGVFAAITLSVSMARHPVSKASSTITTDGPALPQSSLLLLERWLRALAALLGAEAGCVVATDDAFSQAVVVHNLPHAFFSSPVTLSDAPYERDETVILPDATQRQDLHQQLREVALDRTGFFFRKPMLVNPRHVVAVLVYGREPRAPLSEREQTLADELCTAMAEEAERLYPRHPRDLDLHILERTGFEAWVAQSLVPSALFDRDLRLTSVNASLATLVSRPVDEIIGKKLEELALPARESLSFLFRHALETGLSTPRQHVRKEAGQEQIRQEFAVMGSPLSLSDAGEGTSEPAMLVTVERVEPEPSRHAIPDRSGDAATVEFLSETLVRARKLRSRNGCSYVTLRSWRQPIRQHQIKALRALKRNPPAKLAREIASEIADQTMSLFGIKAFRAVIPMPCGHSAPEACLSRAIAQELSDQLDLPMVQALHMAPSPGSSHPKQNLRRSPIELERVVDGAVLLVDDVATSGQHIEEAVTLLREACGGVLAIVWIGGDSDDDA